MSAEVYVVLGVVDYEPGVIMAAFTDEAQAHAYIAEYRATPQYPDGDTYRANFYDYAVIPVTLGAKPIDYAELAENAATWGAKRAGAQ